MASSKPRTGCHPLLHEPSAENPLVRLGGGDPAPAASAVWAVGTAAPHSFRNTPRAYRNQASHANIITPYVRRVAGRATEPPPFGTDRHCVRGHDEPMRLHIDTPGGPRCVSVRRKGVHGETRDTMVQPLRARNALTGEGVETHSGSAHVSQLMSSRDAAGMSLRKSSLGEGARRNLHSQRNVLTGHGVTAAMEHSELRRRPGSRAAEPPDVCAGGGSGTGGARNVLTGEGLQHHHASGSLRASEAHPQHIQSPHKPRRAVDVMRSSAQFKELMQHHDTLEQQPAVAVNAVPTGRVRRRLQRPGWETDEGPPTPPRVIPRRAPVRPAWETDGTPTTPVRQWG
jgi:hypothetical protein